MRRRILPAVVVPALALVALTGCTSSTASALSCDTGLPAGQVASSVQVLTDKKGNLTVKTDSAVITEPERAIVKRASDRSEQSAAGSLITVNFAAFDSKTGEMLSATPSFGSGSSGELVMLNQPENPLTSALQCAAPGDLVSVALPAQLSGIPLSSQDASLIVLSEVVGVRDGAASGTVKTLPSGFPAVVTDESGRPGVVLPPQEAPSKSKSAIRVLGNGEEVTAGQQVFGQVLTVGWDGQIQVNTWDDLPENFGSESQTSPNATGFRDQLTGVPVGSQVVVITTEDGNPRVSVIDILAVL